MVENSPRAVGRPRKFDRDETAARIQHVFWREGYEGASLETLTTATGLHKPSLYGAFGDKRAMYMGVLRDYLDKASLGVRAEMALPTLRETLNAFYGRAIETWLKHPDAPGCFLIATAVPMAASDDEVGEMVRHAMRGLDKALLRRIERARDAGELSEDADPMVLAEVVMAGHYGLAARARTGADEVELRARAGRIVDLVCAR